MQVASALMLREINHLDLSILGTSVLNGKLSVLRKSWKFGIQQKRNLDVAQSLKSRAQDCQLPGWFRSREMPGRQGGCCRGPSLSNTLPFLLYWMNIITFNFIRIAYKTLNYLWIWGLSELIWGTPLKSFGTLGFWCFMCSAVGWGVNHEGNAFSTIKNPLITFILH